MNWTIDFAPLLPSPLLWAAAAIALVLALLLILRRTRGAPLRILALAALFGALMNPILREEERESLSNIALVIVDKSLSQALAKRPQQTKAVREALESRFAKIPNLEVKWITATAPSERNTSGTQLFKALNAALANTPPDRIAGVIMVSDGQVHDIPETKDALGFAAPVHALLTGHPNEFDRRIEIIEAPRYGIVGQTRDIKLRVIETGKKSKDSGTVQLKVRREGQPDETRTTTIGRRETFSMSFPHAGTNIVELELETAEGELTPANNRVVVSAEGVRENLRVLLVSGEPHAGERVWRNLLKSDAAVDLVHFTILRPPEKQDGTPINQLSLIAFPTRELFSEKIQDFDLIIFDRYQHRGILQPLYYDNIARFIDQDGGAVLVAAGDDYAGTFSLYHTALAPVLPAVPTGRVIDRPFKAEITPDGQKHPVTRNLPGATTNKGKPGWGRWFRQVEVAGERGEILMKGAEEKPLLILNRKGKGRIALLTSDHAWLWARGFEGGGPHTDLLRRLSHWLMREPDLEEERLLASTRGMKLTIERHSMLDDVAPVSLKGPAGKSQELELSKTDAGKWKTTIDVGLPGLYKAETPGPNGTLTAVAHAGNEDPREMNEVTATAEPLSGLVESTGGGIFWTSQAGTLSSLTTEKPSVSVPRISMLKNARVLAGSGWLGLKDRDSYLTRGVKLTPMFTGLLALATLLFLLSLAWWREGK